MRRQLMLLGGPFQPTLAGWHRTAGCEVPSVLSPPKRALTGAEQRTVPAPGQIAVVVRSPEPLAPKQIRPALTAQSSLRLPTPMLPWVSWPSTQQPCSMPRSFCAQRSAGNGAGLGCGGGGGGAAATGAGAGAGGGLGASTILHCASLC